MSRTPRNRHPRNQPHEEDHLPAVGTPTLEHQAEFNLTLNALNRDELELREEEILQRVTEFKAFLDNIKDRESRSVAKYYAFSQLKKVDDGNTNILDIFMDQEMMARAQQLLATEDDVHRDTDDSSNDSSSEKNDSDNGDNDLAIERRRRRGGGAAENLQTAPGDLTEKEQFIHAYTRLGWTQGNGGTRATATIVGNIRLPKVTVAPSLAVNNEVDVDQVKELRLQFEDYMKNLRWSGKRMGKDTWMRLHPWSIQILSNFFFDSFIGRGFFRQVNRIVNHWAKPNEAGVLYGTATIAEAYVAANQDLPDSAKDVFLTFAEVVRGSFRNDAYTDYLVLLAEVQLHNKYENFCERVGRQDSAEYRLVRQHNKQPGGRGVGRRSQVKDYFSTVLQLRAEQFNNTIHRAAPIIPFYNAYEECVVMLFERGMVSTLSKIGAGAFPPTINKFNQLVPDFAATATHINAHLVKRLKGLPSGDIPNNAFALRRAVGTDTNQTWLTAVEQGLVNSMPKVEEPEDDGDVGMSGI